MLLLFILLLITSPLVMAVKDGITNNTAKPNCQTKCGNITVPYPFGIGTDCSLNPSFNLICNTSSEPAKLLLGSDGTIQIYDISDLEFRISTLVSYMCYNQSGFVEGYQISNNLQALKEFTFSEKNMFTVVGCDDYAWVTGTVEDDFTAGCFGVCIQGVPVPYGQCSGIGCCQFSIPKGLSFYNATLRTLANHSDVWQFNECSYGFLVEEGRYEFDGANDLATNYSDFVERIESSMPILVDWVIAPEGNCTAEVNTCKGNSSCYDVDHSRGYRCKCNDGYQGNPYLLEGCQDIDECSYQETYPCYGICSNTIGSYRCVCPPGYFGDGFIKNGCFVRPKKHIWIVLIIGVSLGVFLLLVVIVLPKKIKKSKEERQRKRFFTRNGGLLLKQQEEADPSLVDKTIHFTSRELEKATDKFNENRILGRGGHGTVYKGMLVDGRIIAVKKSKIVDESELEQFINEVVILSQINHRNVVKLLGCCLETDVPLLVSEFIPNGTLYDCLHNESEEFSISLNMRLQIAAEVAGALAYLHSATFIPVYHRDVKTSNILLDDKYRAKVSDFGTSRFVLKDQTHLTTLVKGTFGYVDPEYFQSSQFTEKSDVYSFGVVLVELLTGEKAISHTRFGENKSLATHFMSAMEEGRVMSILDGLVLKEGSRDDLLALANLGMRCLNLNGKYRPTMKEVATQLETIRTSHVPSTVKNTIRPVRYGEELTMLSYGESSSSVFLSFSDNINK